MPQVLKHHRYSLPALDPLFVFDSSLFVKRTMSHEETPLHVDNVSVEPVKTVPAVPSHEAPSGTGPTVPTTGAGRSDTTDDEWDFDLKLQSFPFTAKGLDGQRRRYFVFELTGTQRDEYLTFIGGKTVESANGSRRVKNFKDIHAYLLAKAVYEQGHDSPVPLAVIQSWPASMQSKLYTKARELSALDAEEGDDGGEGND